MVSQLLKNDKISFVVSKPFTSRGKDYSVGEDFPQEEARDIEVFVRSRYVIPVVEELADKPRHWHRHIRPRDEVLERLSRDRTQLRMPHEPDSDEVVNIPQLTHPETTPDAEDIETTEITDTNGNSLPEPAEAVHTDQYDPSYHTVLEVNSYLAGASEEERERVLAAERDGRARKGILEV